METSSQSPWFPEFCTMCALHYKGVVTNYGEEGLQNGSGGGGGGN